MTAIDWTRGDLMHSVEIWQVDPLDLTTTHGTLPADVTGGSWDIDIDSDTKQSAKLSLLSADKRAGWDGRSALRIVHVTSDYTGRLGAETLFTGIVRSLSWTKKGERYAVEIELGSMLKALELETVSNGWYMPRGSHAVATFHQLCGLAGRKCYTHDLQEREYSYDLSFKAGTTLRKILSYLISDVVGVTDTDENGVVIAYPYVNPSDRTATFEVDALSDRSPVLGQEEGADATLDIPSRVIVRSETQDDYALGIFETGNRYDRNARGYLLDDFQDEAQLEPFTSAHAYEVARRRGLDKLAQREKRQQGLMYRPLSLRSVEELRDEDGISRWYVNAGTLDLKSFTWKLDLRKC